MQINGKAYRTIWRTSTGEVEIIDQTKLPHAFVTYRLASLQDVENAISDMRVRGAPLIGATAAYGVAIAMTADASDAGLSSACEVLLATRPTAVNLRWALDDMRTRLAKLTPERRAAAAFDRAADVCDEDVAICQSIGTHGARLIADAAAKSDGPVNVLTHCNAGWLATVDWGTALAPIYTAHNAGVELHVWVDETRPRNQGASLTAWELGQQGIPHTVIVDNAGGHLMQRGMVDLSIVGTDRTTATGDVCNKIGTYLKALAAEDNGVPFYVGLPSSTVDWSMNDGVAEIPIEQRGADEVTHITGRDQQGRDIRVQLTPDGSPAANYGFDVTPARLVTGLITERGVCGASKAGLASLFPELAGGQNSS